ncbi:MAG: transposase [Lysobacter sp.]|nr:transposase [Lysobacter sp.]
MPRHARLDIPGLPRHIGIRAVNGMPCLNSDLDRNVFLKYLREAMEGTDFQLHAFVLMGNHVHLLATTHVTGTASKVMHYLGMQYARYFNHHCDRTGPLFQGRYWASLIESQQYFFQAMRYIELNPVRAGMVDAPEKFPWSSHPHNTGRGSRAEITPHEEFIRLGGSPAERSKIWTDFVAQGISQPELDRIRRRFRKCRPFGSDDFEKRLSPEKWDGSVEPSHRPVP